ncbi:ankyrin repeat domain-containing protein [Catenuloplanes sp. NPDC051500]|uniref:ankyrin repeat domain-containing protein n=1 Tax=Catenuloplanes sp. NPDC051500 TaxID=3363959 RepID=UPI0037983244
MREPMVITCARDGDVLVLGRILVEDPTAANARGGMGETPLHAAAASGAAEAVRVLIGAGADVRARRHNGDTALHRAATAEIAELLFRASGEIDPDQRNQFGQTPLHCARDGEVSAVLLRCGASLSARDNRGGTPLHHAGAAKARVLLNAGADIGARDDQGRTPLHHAVLNGDMDLVTLLLREGADAVTRDHGGSSPVHLARRRESQEIRVLLASAGGALTEPTSPPIVVGSSQRALHLGRDGGIAYSVAGHATLVRWRCGWPWVPEVIVSTEHAAIRHLAVHPRRRLIAVVPVDGPAELRDDDLSDPESLHGLENVSALAFSPDGRWLAAATGPERVVLFDLDARRVTADAEAGERTDCVSFSADGSLLATTCSFQAGAHVRVDRVTEQGTLELITEVERPASDTIPAVVFTPDGRHLVIWETSSVGGGGRAPGWRGSVLLAGIDGTVTWQRDIDARTTGVRAPLEAVGAPMGWFTKPCITADGRMIVLGFDGNLVLLSTGDGDCLAVLPVDGMADSAAIDPLTGTLLVATDRGLREIEMPADLGGVLRNPLDR